MRGQLESEEYSSVSSSTEQIYQYDWLRFGQWCAENRRPELPAHPVDIAHFLKWEMDAGSGVATLNRRVSAISYMHRKAGVPPPLAHHEAKAIRELLLRPPSQAPRRSRTKRTVDLWQEVLEQTAEDDVTALRDRALIALHAAAAFRLLELARLTPAQVRLERSSALIQLGRFRSHTARGASVITLIDDRPLTPVSHLRLWIEAAGPTSGALFRHCADEEVTAEPLVSEEIADIMRRRIIAAGHSAKHTAGGLIQVVEGSGARRTTDRAPP
ncbi:hypothetical protein AcidC75_29330 [Acidisoma sp. C75]